METKKGEQNGWMNAMRRSNAVRGIQTWLDAIFLVLYGMYIFYRAARVTTMSLPWPGNADEVLLVALSVAAAARAIVCVGPRRPAFWIGAALVVVCRLTHNVGEYGFLLFLDVSIVGLAGIDHRRILKTHLILTLSVLAVAVTAALAGSTENIVYYRDGLRSSWGICYPTDFSSYVLFGMIALWVAWEGLNDWAALSLGLAPVCLALCVTQSRNSLVCGALFIAAMGYSAFERRVIDRRPQLRWMKGGVNGLLVAAFPLCAAVIFVAVFLYSRGVPLAERLNEALSDRLRLSLDAIQAHGFQPFGSKFSMSGLGGSTFSTLEYNFIDSTYVLVSVRYGWVLFLALGGLWVALTVRAIRCGRRRLALALGLIAFHSITEHHFIELHYNVFLGLTLAGLAAREGDGERQGDAASARRRTAAAGIALALLGLVLVMTLPRVLTRMRTVFHTLSWQGSGEAVLPALAVILVALGAVATGTWAVNRAAYAALSRKRVTPWAYLALLLCVAVGIAGHICSERVIDDALQKNAQLLDGERAAMEAITGAATSGVYVDGQPNVYERRFGGIRATAFAGNDLARYDVATAVMDAATEYNVFFQRGYRFAQISDAHAVYTSDPAVSDALSAAGYDVTQYWSKTVKADLESLAGKNRLRYSEKGLLLNGTKHCLKRGDRDSVYGGSYLARYSLLLGSATRRKIDATGTDALVCTLRVTAYKGAVTLAEVPVYRSQFDDQRQLTVEIPFATGGVRALELLAFTEDDMKVYVQQIEYRKVG